jgi:cytidylate kinase
MIILLSGKAGSGKDAAALILCEEMQFHRLAFADVLKEDVAKQTGIPIQTFHAKKDIIYDAGISYRTLLIEHAAAAKAVDIDIYARKVADLILAKPNKWVISDWRHYSELKCLLNRGLTVVTVRINRPATALRSHFTETELDNYEFDHVIENDGSISDLRDKLKDLIHFVTL